VNITLIKSGGPVGNKMSASIAWKFSDAEWHELVNAIKREEGQTKARDAFHYSIQKNDDADSRVPVSIQNIPAKFSAVFKDLFDGMKPEK
jgi:hypothetical protein